MMRVQTLFILGLGVKFHGQIWPPVRRCSALHCPVLPILCISVYMADFLKYPPHILDMQQVLLDQRMKCIARSCRTELFFIRKSDRSDSFQELCTVKKIDHNSNNVVS